MLPAQNLTELEQFKTLEIYESLVLKIFDFFLHGAHGRIFFLKILSRNCLFGLKKLPMAID